MLPTTPATEPAGRDEVPERFLPQNRGNCAAPPPRGTPTAHLQSSQESLLNDLVRVKAEHDGVIGLTRRQLDRARDHDRAYGALGGLPEQRAGAGIDHLRTRDCTIGLQRDPDLDQHAGQVGRAREAPEVPVLLDLSTDAVLFRCGQGDVIREFGLRSGARLRRLSFSFLLLRLLVRRRRRLLVDDVREELVERSVVLLLLLLLLLFLLLFLLLLLL